MKSMCKKADVPYINFHEQRHTHASLALKIGVEAKVIQEKLGHSKLSITMDSSKPAEKFIREVFRFF